MVTYTLPSQSKQNDRSTLSKTWQRVKQFYNAPVVHYHYNLVSTISVLSLFPLQPKTMILLDVQIFFILFLGLFSYVVLTDYRQLNVNNQNRFANEVLGIPLTQLILLICILSLLLDEFYQVSISTIVSSAICHKFIYY